MLLGKNRVAYRIYKGKALSIW